MKSVVMVKQKGGVGGSFVAELICEAFHGLGSPALLVEVETNEARLARLLAADRVRGHAFVPMPTSEDILLDRNVAASFWEAPLEAAVSNEPVVVDIGAQGYKSLEFYASIDVETSPLGRADGQHGAGIVFCCVTDSSVDGQREAAASVVGLRSLFPGADIVVVGNLGADLATAKRIAAAASGVRAIAIDAAPDLEIFRSFFSKGGLFGLATLLTDKTGTIARGKELGFDRIAMLLAARNISSWLVRSLDSASSMLRETGAVDSKVERRDVEAA
jgi:hypothetical protein